MPINTRTTRTPFREYLRFGITGAVNTGVDIGVLNALILMFGTAVRGGIYTSFKIISFLAAVTNSYFLNKYWVFKKQGAKARKLDRNESGKFLAVSLIGFALNILGSLLIYTYLSKLGLFDTPARANIGALFGTAIVLVWNYAGYKFFVFNTRHE